MRTGDLGGLLSIIALGIQAPGCFLSSIGEAQPDGDGGAQAAGGAEPTGGGGSPSSGGGGEGGEGEGGSPDTGGNGGDGGDGGAPTPTSCGDMQIQSPETCDDGNTTTGDGCSAQCESEDSCPGALFTLGTGESAHVDGNTSGQGNQGSSSGCNGYGANSNDLVYAVRADDSGTLSIDWNASYNGHVYVRGACDIERSEVDCSESDQGTITLPILAGVTLYVIVDGGNSENGAFTLDLALGPVI